MSKKGICLKCGQEKIIHGKGYCQNCYQNAINNGEILRKQCKIEGCEKNVRAKGYCQRHYMQLYKNGKIKGNPSRSMLMKNEIIIKDTYAEIVIYNNEGYEKCRALIDIEDIEKVKEYKWGCSNKSYISSFSKKKKNSLHRFIMNCNDNNLVVDHINHNPLDNRKCNLRICTPIENGMNLSIPITNTTGIIGLFYNKGLDKWQANITVNSHVIVLGTFDNRDDAIKERLKAEVVYFKEFAPQQHLYEEYGINKNVQYNVKEYTPRKEGNPKKVIGIFKGSGNYKDKWKVEFKYNKKNIYLGYYEDLDEAIKAKEEYINKNQLENVG